MDRSSVFKILVVALFSTLMAWLIVGYIDNSHLFSFQSLEIGSGSENSSVLSGDGTSDTEEEDNLNKDSVSGLEEEDNLNEDGVSNLEEDIDPIEDSVEASGFELEEGGGDVVAPEEESLRELSDTVVYTRDSMEVNELVTNEPFFAVSAEDQAGDEHLTRKGIIYYTNRERSGEGVRSLVSNGKLDQDAKIKMDSMFEIGYFAHEDPDGGMGVNFLADMVGYDYIVTGENLAMGDFSSDEDLVEAWMDSPGHRLNIINERYTEIGVAVGRGLYQDREIWMAVQVFGKPISDCPTPDLKVELAIEEGKDVLNVLSREIDILTEELEADNFSSRDEYLETVERYNSLVKRYNELLEEVKLNIAILNTQIDLFNECAKN